MDSISLAPLPKSKMRIGVALLICWSTALPVATPADEPIRFEDITNDSGIVFKHYSGGTGKHYIVETVTSGLITLDYDGDGLLDVYLLNGAPLLNAKPATAPTNQLFRNEGNMRFRDVTDASAAGDLGFALGGVAGDYDNDGDPDIFITNFGATVLLENRGDGTFSRREFYQGNKPRIGAGAALLDVEGDGNLDLYVSNYVDFSFDQDVNRLIFGVPAAPGPKDYAPDADSLYRNRGDGSFTDITQASGIGAHAGPGMGIVAFDYDDDGDTDVYVCNDSAANFLFENNGEGKFEEIGLLTSVAYDVTGSRQASMGVDAADWNRDGRLDMVTTNFVDELPTLYENSGAGYFDDIGAAAGLGVADRSVTWGVGFADFDNDQWPDLFIAAGHLLAGVSLVNDSEKFEAPNIVLRNMAGQRFEDQTIESGAAVSALKVSRGIACEDLNGDGLQDVIVLNLNAQPQILRNTTRTKGKSLSIRLIGTRDNRDGVGARVQVELPDGQRLTDQVIAGRGYQSHFGSLIHFGLGDQAAIKIIVKWLDGSEQTHTPSGSASSITIIQN